MWRAIAFCPSFALRRLCIAVLEGLLSMREEIAMSEEKHGSGQSAAASASKKLDEFFSHLNSAEQKVIADMVRASLLQAAEHSEHEKTIPDFVTGLTGQHAPALIKSLRLPGTLAAHSIPGCNASALAILREEASNR
jgi:dGTP triphosphohydrolase